MVIKNQRSRFDGQIWYLQTVLTKFDRQIWYLQYPHKASKCLV